MNAACVPPEKVSEMVPELQDEFLPFYPDVAIFYRKYDLPLAITMAITITLPEPR
jgi:hypothetical protein